MLVSLMDLTKFKAKADDISPSISEIFVDRKTWRVQFLALDIGGWFSRRSAVVSADRITEMSASDRSLKIDLTKQMAEDAPDLHEFAGSSGNSWDESYVFPSLFTASAAGAISPMLLDMSVRPGDVTDDPDPAQAERLERMFPLTEATRSEAFNSEGPVGRVIDFLANPETLTVTHVVVDTGESIAESQRVIPVSAVSRVAKGENHTVLDISKDKIEHGPRLEHFDRVDRNWLDTTAAYYGVSA
ncbi:hypothetical protein [Algicella marina]|uniref:PRC-barrel domain containing protein n=1 Tax=Algicella marina TaxID=2683284 RepID=A0A6P1SZ56_9RHOB|nr:hypothetical protein [Algicella marina]QHQ35027.1 hypothetical protein GO499_07375 [Algicella marina]